MTLQPHFIANRRSTAGLQGRVARHLAVLVGALAALAAAQAHDFSRGSIVIDHPYAVPSDESGQSTRAYLRGLRNTGHQDDRLLGASTPVAKTTTLRCVSPGASEPGVTTLPVPAGATVPLRHDGDCELRLDGLSRPMKVGDHLPLILKFEHAGDIEVHVDVQQPRARRAAS